MLLSLQCLELAEPPRHLGQHELAVLALRLDALENKAIHARLHACTTTCCWAGRGPRWPKRLGTLLSLQPFEPPEIPGHAAEPAAPLAGSSP